MINNVNVKHISNQLLSEINHIIPTNKSLQPIPADFKMKPKVETLLDTNGFEKKRSRTMDIDDFLS